MLDRSIRTTTQQQHSTAAAMVHIRHIIFQKGTTRPGKCLAEWQPYGASLHCGSPGAHRNREIASPLPAGDGHPLLRSIHRPAGAHVGDTIICGGRLTASRRPRGLRHHAGERGWPMDRRSARMCGRASSYHVRVYFFRFRLQVV